jgi:replicative DNA helicase
MDLKMIDIQGTPDVSSTFGKAEEYSIISLIFDEPNFMAAILPYLEIDYFEQDATKYVFAIIKHHYDKHGVITSRDMVLDIVNQDLTADDPVEAIVGCVKKELDPRESPIVIDRLVEWAKKKAYGKIYSKDSIEAHERGEYDHIEKIIDEARRITDSQGKFYFFFKEIDALFKKDDTKKLSSGFPRLDAYLNQGGPTRGEVLCYMAATGVGKSCALINLGTRNIKQSKNVLHISLEDPIANVADRYMGCFSKVWLKRKFNQKEDIKERLAKIVDTYHGNLILLEYPADDITVDTIHANLDILRRIHGINIDVVIIDYLELLLSRIKEYNDTDYTRQKHISTEILRLAKKENVFVATATQTNRGGNDNLNSTKQDQVVEVNKISESYAKAMPLQYLISLNQTKDEYESGKVIPATGDGEAPNTQAKCRLYIAKNRNGPKFKTLEVEINYETMEMREWVK